jgi:hypothetical protein
MMTFCTVDEDISCSLQHLLSTLSPNQHSPVCHKHSLTVRYPYHTSILTGEGWVLELLTGHPWQIWTELGVSHHVFEQLTITLQSLGLNDSYHVRLEEQLAIFLYALVTSLSVWHLGERFQHANGTISLWVDFILFLFLFTSNLGSYFWCMVLVLSSPPFYTRHIQLPGNNDLCPPKIHKNSKF